jgi:integrase
MLCKLMSYKENVVFHKSLWTLILYTVACHVGTSKVRSDGFRRIGECLYRYGETGNYYAFIRHQGILFKESLKTKDLAFAKRKLTDLRAKKKRVDHKAGKITLNALCSRYVEGLRQAPRTLAGKKTIQERIKRDWPGSQKAEVQISSVRPADVGAWLASYDFGPAAYNSYLWFVRGALAFAVENKWLADNAADSIKAEKRDAPIRLTPNFEQFRAIVGEIRTQTKNARRGESADFVEFMGLAGVGNAETINLTWGDIDFKAGNITLLRQKTRKGYRIPLFPQLRPMLEARKGDRSPSVTEPVFTIKSAKKSMKAACDKLNYTHFDHRSLRRMFVTRALQNGVDVKTVSMWQGHRDGGQLILSTYSHVLNDHRAKMAELMVGGE